MTLPRRAGPFLVLAFALAAGCGPKRPAEPPAKQDLVVLLPDPQTGATGSITVSNSSGSVELKDARQATRVSANAAPTAPSVLDDAEVNRVFGPALSTLPPTPRHFDLYFRFESDELTDESRALVPEILKVVGERPFPDVSIVGHTDTSGNSKSNFDLGLKRAMTIRGWLVARGLDPKLVEVASHGEADLLVRTADDTPEPKNRRVEIAVK
jgi:outer membrane protein OmpA-like peptidoglycan-associated protein